MRNTSFTIDRMKARKTFDAIIESDPNLNSRSDLSRRLGYTPAALNNVVNKCNVKSVMSWCMLEKLKAQYGCSLEDFVPDPEPEPKPEPVVEPDPKAVEPLPPYNNEQDREEIARLFSLLESINQNLKQVLSVTPGVMDIHVSIVNALKEAKSSMVRDIMKDLKGAVFAATLEALKKNEELKKEKIYG